MASTYNQVAMGDTAAIVIASNTDRRKLILKNTGSNIVYIGNDNSVVDTANNANGGYPIAATETFYLNDYTGDIYGICASGLTSEISLIEEVIA
jgi:hypothetical protein|tara:strand:+ start:363 stop:644 length:282 start_codon:yes stop_codon:yes gene_type:complete